MVPRQEPQDHGKALSQTHKTSDTVLFLCDSMKIKEKSGEILSQDWVKNGGLEQDPIATATLNYNRVFSDSITMVKSQLLAGEQQCESDWVPRHRIYWRRWHFQHFGFKCVICPFCQHHFTIRFCCATTCHYPDYWARLTHSTYHESTCANGVRSRFHT